MRTFVQRLKTAMVTLLGTCAGLGTAASRSVGEWTVYVGTFTTGADEGIYLFRMDAASGTLSAVGTAPAGPNPAFLAIHPNGRFLYAVNEVREFEGAPSGSLRAFSIDSQTGRLSPINAQPTAGESPCYTTVDRKGRFVLTANYAGGSVSVHPVRPDGGLGPMTDSIQHRGSGPNPRRQEGPHAHSIVLDPHNRFAFAPDLGLDKIMVYRFDRRRGTLRPNRPGWVSTAPGAGPRHFCFHPDGRHAYAINELNSTLDAFAYGAENGSLERLATVSTLPDSFRGQNTCADVHVAPSGKFVYGSNRGHDSIAIFRVDSNRGTLTRIACEPTRGRTPRNFAIDPSGSWLLVANQNTGNLVVFRVDPITGMLRPTGQEVKVPSPVCIRFLPHGQ